MIIILLSGAPPITDLLPTHYMTVHQCAIRAVVWVRAPTSWPSGRPRIDEDPTVVATGGYDGLECMTDIREGHGSIMNRTRGNCVILFVSTCIEFLLDVINTMSYSSYVSGPVTIDHENIVKSFSASPSMLGRGHSLMEPNGPVWVSSLTSCLYIDQSQT